MKRLYLLAEIDKTEIAIASDRVEAVMAVQDVIAVPQGNPMLIGLFALRSRVLALIDCREGESRRSFTPGDLAIIVELGSFTYGLRVDAVCDAVWVEDEAIEHGLKPSPAWQAVVEGALEIEGRLVMVLSPNKLVAQELPLAA